MGSNEGTRSVYPEPDTGQVGALSGVSPDAPKRLKIGSFVSKSPVGANLLGIGAFVFVGEPPASRASRAHGIRHPPPSAAERRAPWRSVAEQQTEQT
jgi:hypothetical protein